MLYTIPQLLFLSAVFVIASVLITRLIYRNKMLDLLTRQRTELDARLAWRSVEHENALVAANEQVRASQEARREAEQRLAHARSEISQRVSQYDETIANLHRNLRNHQDKLREAQRRADTADERVNAEHVAREEAERRLRAAQARGEELEATVARYVAEHRGSDREMVLSLEKELRGSQEHARDLEVRLKTAQAAVGDRSALERRLLESQERLRSVEAELSNTSHELSRLRVAHQAKIAVLEGRLRDYEKELDFAESRLDQAVAEQTQAHQAAMVALQGQLQDARRQLTIAREQIDERDEDLDRLEGELEVLRDAAAAQVSDAVIVEDLERRRKAAEALASERLVSLERAEAEAVTAEAAAREAQAARDELSRRLAEVQALAEEHGAVRGRLEEELDEIYDAIGDQPAAEVARRLAAAEALASERRQKIEALEGELAAARAAAHAAADRGEAQAAVEARVVELESELAARSADLERLVDEVSAGRGRDQALAAARQRIAELEAATPGTSAGEEEVLAARTRIAELEARLDAATEEAAEHVEDIAAKTQEIERLREALAAAGEAPSDDPSAELAVEVAAAQRRASDAEARLEQAGIMAQEQISAHEEELASLQVKLQTYGARLSESEAMVAQQMQSIVALERELAQVRRERAAMGGRLQDAELGAYQAEEALASIRRERDALSEQVQAMSQRLVGDAETTERLLGARDQAIADLERELATLRARLESAAADARALQAQDAERSDAVEREESDLADRLIEAMRRIEQATGAIAERDEAILDLQAQNAELLARLSAPQGEREEARALAAAVAERDRATAELQRSEAALRARLAAAEGAEAALRASEAAIGERDRLIAELRERVDAAEARALTAADDGRARALEEALAERDRTIAELREQAMVAVKRFEAVTLVGESELDPTSPDELRSITGIGPVIERKLVDAGIRTYRQIAVLDDAAIEALSGPLAPLRARFRRENWVEQAKKLHLAKYGEVV